MDNVGLKSLPCRALSTRVKRRADKWKSSVLVQSEAPFSSFPVSSNFDQEISGNSTKPHDPHEHVRQKNKYRIFCLRDSTCTKTFWTPPEGQGDLQSHPRRLTLGAWAFCGLCLLLSFHRNEKRHTFCFNSRLLCLKWEVYLNTKLHLSNFHYLKSH